MKLSRKIMLLAACAMPSVSAQARTARLLIDSRETVQDSAITAQTGPYELLRGRLLGEVDPAAPGNRIIQDLALAPRNAKGRVEYVSTFTLLRPLDPAKASGVLVDALPNRGHRGVASWRGPGLVDPLYYQKGYAVLWIGWQGDLAEKPDADRSAAGLKLESIRVPVAKAAGGKTITGRYLVRVPTDDGAGPSGAIMHLDQGNAGALIYHPASFDTARATLTGGAPEDASGKPTGPRYTIAPADWRWWDCKGDKAPADETPPADLCVKRLKGAFRPQESYTLTFDARDPLVLGLGLAALRDGTAFFRHAQADDAGQANPLARQVRFVIGQGVSQVGNLVKTVIALGFNADEQGRKVWDGAHAHIAGRLTPIDYRFATPGSGSSLFMPGSEGVVWWGKAANTVRGGPPRSMLDRCGGTDTSSGTCPLIFETFGGSELWALRISSNLATLDLAKDIALPANVRRYYLPGTAHGGGPGGFALTAPQGICQLPLNPNPQSDQIRALTVALVDWVSRGTPPPDSAFPSLAAGTLVDPYHGGLHGPALPGVAPPLGLANPVLVYDFGPRFDYVNQTGLITRQPPAILRAVPALAAQVDADGNETSGVPSVQMMAPLGSYLSWNRYREGPYAGQLCTFNAGFVPFARNAQERMASGDSRPSIEERYHTRAGYVSAVRAATVQAVARRFLLQGDAEALVHQAQDATQRGDLAFLKP